jgi:hypothetical protein
MVVAFVIRSDKFEMTAEGEGADDVPRDETNLIVTGGSGDIRQTKR